MADTYFPILVLIILSTGFLVMMLMLSIFLGPQKHSEMKDEPFECGTIGTGDPKQRLNVKFYLVAVTFIVFDIEIVFLYPWAVNLVEFGWSGLWVMLPFLILLIVGLLYEFKRGVLNWA